ncbi:pentapeptide repeat-containing protein [Actinoplanes aureus]|uniref:Pentapeptide repeat-containing protein n=1 Tax=Actinoplanes aureus TaxID=2792083 RepID=A0A931C186_9ACTN|nr:pentapeptide repeat-containing protein [Actinoplanes aureus]MBG0561440.1 pentapeptide repeat-containing protein [Actinoplanes aureus]
MPARDDVHDEIRVTEVHGDVRVTGAALSTLSMRQGTAKGDVRIRRSSITEDVDFEAATLEGDIVFDDLEVLGSLQLNNSTIAGDFRLKNCTFRSEFTFAGATIRGRFALRDSRFLDHALLEHATAQGELQVSGVAFPRGISFRRGVCHGPVRIDRSEATGLDFAEATFNDSLDFTDATFADDFDLDRGTYFGPVTFRRVAFTGSASLTAVTMLDTADFTGCTFHGDVEYDRGTYQGRMRFEDCSFEQEVSFSQALFQDHLRFSNVTFHGPVTFQEGLFRSAVVFEDVVFEGPVFFNFAHFRGGLVLERVTFRNEARFDMVADFVTLKRAVLGGASAIVVAGGRISLEECVFDGPTTLAGPGRGSGTPRGLISVKGSDLTNLTVTDIGLRRCRLSEGHNLDKMIIEDPAFSFERTPWTRRWTARHVVLEEVLYRALDGPAGRRDDWSRLLPLGTGRSGVDPRRAARTYRELRKGLEDSKNEPDAADFYYGEMEMRRAAARGLERLLLTAYWLTSGYALRASRALAFLALLVGVSTAVVAWAGFSPPSTPPAYVAAIGAQGTPQAFWITPAGELTARPPAKAANDFRSNLLPALVYCAESATVVFRGPEQRTTTLVGRWCQIVLRILGPLLLGLAALSLRGRVKR